MEARSIVESKVYLTIRNHNSFLFREFASKDEATCSFVKSSRSFQLGRLVALRRHLIYGYLHIRILVWQFLSTASGLDNVNKRKNGGLRSWLSRIYRLVGGSTKGSMSLHQIVRSSAGEG
jgi:hypothetical protein